MAVLSHDMAQQDFDYVLKVSTATMTELNCGSLVHFIFIRLSVCTWFSKTNSVRLDNEFTLKFM